MSNRKAKFRQPKGYYQQVITETKFMTPRQRFMHVAMGLTIVHGKFFGVKPSIPTSTSASMLTE